MKRRLDLALALVHRPSLLFLDGSRPRASIRRAQRRGTRWSGWPRRTATSSSATQYLEEADVLADRVGIIDRGQIVAEGTPDELKRDIGGDTVEAIPADPHDLERAADVLARFGQRAAHSPKGVAVRLSRGAEQLAEIVRALDDAGIALAHLQLHSPSLDDVFLAKTGRSLEGAGEEGEAGAPPRSRCRRDLRPGSQVGLVARRSVRRTLRQPALIVPTIVFPLFLLAVNSSGLSAATDIPGFPAASYLDFAITVCFIQGAMFAAITAGTELATDIQSGFLNRLQLSAATAGDPGRPDGGRDDAGAAGCRDRYLAVGVIAGVDVRAAWRARPCSSSTRCSSPSRSRGSAPRWARGPARPRRCRAPSRSCSPSSSCRP